MTLSEQLEELKQEQRKIEKSIEEIKEKIEEEKLKELTDEITAYDLVLEMKKRANPLDCESYITYNGAKRVLNEMRKGK